MKTLSLVLLSAFCFLLLPSCSTQVITKVDGTRIVNNNLFSKGTLTVDPSGKVLMRGDSEKAAEQLAKHLRTAAMIGLAGQGVEAMKDVGVKALNQQ